MSLAGGDSQEIGDLLDYPGMQSKPQNTPNRHHFIPEFLLKEWAVFNKGELLRYWNTGRGIASKPQSPRSVCFEHGLYRTTGLPPEHEQQMETLFMGPIDNGAATAHARMLDGGVDQLTDQQRSDWGRFIMSLWFRTPTDVQHLWDAVSKLTDPVVGPGLLGSEIPEPLPPIAIKQLQMDVMRNAIDNKERGETLINMEWSVLQADHALEFWISDWPMDLPSSAPWLGSATSYVTVPISPNRLFIAAGSRELLDRIRELPDRTLIIRQNRATVRHALNFVGATNGLGADYIRANFGIFERPSILGGIAARYRDRIPGSA